MKNILGIIGSPRKNGNTEVLVSRILEGARDGGANTEVVSLGALDIQECDGCHACWKGRFACAKKDDMQLLYPKIIASDVIVFGTPVYWYGPTALLKSVFDRFVYFNCPTNREKIRGKTAVIAVPFEDETPETCNLVVDFFDKSLGYLEMSLAEKILVPGVTKRGEVRNQQDVMEKCFHAGQRLANMRE